MTKCDLLLHHATVLTMDEEFHIYPQGAVAISGKNILAVGTQDEIRQQFQPAEELDCGGKVLMPGLVNAHTHVPMTLLRGLADDLRLDVWLMGYMMPVEREFVSPEFVRLGTKIACAEMIRSGVTSFADMYYFEDDVAAATAEVGMRGVCGQTVLKFPTPDASSYDEALAYARKFIENWKGHSLIVPSIAPHAPYTCPPEILRACVELAVEYDIPLQIHIAETALEVEAMRKEQGMPVVPYVRKHGLFEAKVLAAHCVHIDEGETRTLQHAGAGIAHNPSSNLKLASGFAPVKRMLELGVNLGIGTDGPASNNDLDMFEEVRLAALLAKASSDDPTAMPAREALACATRLGAQAMHIGHITGSIEPGKRADLILVDINLLHNLPHFRRDPQSIYSQLVYAAKSNDVQDVMIDGRWLMRDRRLLTIEESSLLASAQEYAHKIDQFLITREQSVISKLIAIGGATEEESFEIQVKVPIQNPAFVLNAIRNPAVRIVRQRHYREYDNYFHFDDPEQGFLRYREDEFIGANGEITNVRSRLTHIGPASKTTFEGQVLLSRSRFLAPANHSLRFYREYFKPSSEQEIQKDRRRFLVSYKNTEFFVNVDDVKKPHLGHFLEIKSRTWSRKDAQEKARLALELVQLLSAPEEAGEKSSQDYFEMTEA